MTRQVVPSPAPVVFDQDLKRKVVSLAGHLPALWADPGTGDARRKALLRCLVEKVIIDRGPHDVASVRIVWRGGAVSELTVARPVTRMASLSRGTEMIARILELAHLGYPDDEIAAVLTREGHRSPHCTDRVMPVTVQRIRLAAGLRIKTPRTRWRCKPGWIGINAMAERMGVPAKWLCSAIRDGRILINHQPGGAYYFKDAPEVIASLKELRNRSVAQVDLRTHQPD